MMIVIATFVAKASGNGLFVDAPPINPITGDVTMFVVSAFMTAVFVGFNVIPTLFSLADQNRH